MDQLHTRLDALEQQMRTMHRRLLWWRGLACGLLALAVLTWALPSGTAQEDARGGGPGLAHRLAALEQKLKHMTLVTAADNLPEVRITGANLRIVNGLGSTDCTDEQEEPIPDCPNGLGNLIVGYNELRPPEAGENIRTGSHNVVVGERHNFSGFGGLVVGFSNEISGPYAVVSGRGFNRALGRLAVVSGGEENLADGGGVVSGGAFNAAEGNQSSVFGGGHNTASGESATVSGGGENIATGRLAVVSGGSFWPR